MTTLYICPSCHEILGETVGQPNPRWYGQPYLCPKCHTEHYLTEFEHIIKEDTSFGAL